MLHKDKFIIAPETFSLIQQLQALPELAEFYLVGGTTLALLLGHRNSIDIDLFTTRNFENAKIISLIKSNFDFTEKFAQNNTIIGFINTIKVDFISHPYPLINPPFTEEGITMLSLEDICAMKIHAITNSGQRLKDFIDVYFLLEHFSIKQMVGFYELKYPRRNPVIALRAITYFGDIDPDMDAPKMQKKVTLKQIEARITDAVIHSNKVYITD